MKRTMSRIVAAALLVAIGLTGAMACSNQGEGERCDPNNDNEDCASGLTCRKIEGQESPLCCPPVGEPATVSACIPGRTLQPDSGTEDTGTEDTGTEDTGTEDTGTEDTGTEDTGTEDTGTEDASTEDVTEAG